MRVTLWLLAITYLGNSHPAPIEINVVTAFLLAVSLLLCLAQDFTEVARK